MLTEKHEGIFKYLDCSTAHVRPKDMDLLIIAESIVTIPHKYGAFVNVPNPDDEAEALYNRIREEGFSEDFIKILKFAYANNCYWINFDADGIMHHKFNDLSDLWETESESCSSHTRGVTLPPVRETRKKYTFIVTPSHGYLIVPVDEVREAVKRGARISKYSVVVDDKVYLEEDCDAPAFVQTMDISSADIESVEDNDFIAKMHPSFTG